ncbi:MAG TPA: 6-carboxytetrahydropterin synthase QueD, partial [Moraxellaceae bacterium]|nr:6-carboxytetrahydropterin synthase QueD [Moraxellaceae bacterium]
MRIRKLFKFENAHIVRNCSSDRCKYSIHGHSYQI